MNNKFQTTGLYMFFFMVLILCSKAGFAQSNKSSNLSLYVHGLYGTALDNSSQNRYNGGFGGVTGICYGAKNTYAVGSIGYTSFHAKGTLVTSNQSYIPLKVGVRELFPINSSKIFGQADVGVGFISSNVTSASYVVKSSDSRFAFDIGVGARLGKSIEAAVVWDNFKEVKPDGWSSWLTFQLGWALDF